MEIIVALRPFCLFNEEHLRPDNREGLHWDMLKAWFKPMCLWVLLLFMCYQHVYFLLYHGS